MSPIRSISAGQVTAALSVTGTLIRYSFYAAGVVAFGLIATTIMYVSSFRVKQVEERPAFHLAAPQLDRLPQRSYIEAGRSIGRVELLQYGQLHDREADMGIVMVIPTKGWPAGRDIMREFHDVRPLREVSSRVTATFYDLETRFGQVRAADLFVDADGRRKVCLAFLTRFETEAVYFKGWYCEANGNKPSADRLACMLDRLVIDRELPTKEADSFMRARAAKAGYCSAVPVSQTFDTRAPSRPSSPSRWSQPSAQQRRY
jgi:hypothetical protein